MQSARNRLSALALASVALCCSTSTILAADLPVAKAAPPPVAAPLPGWQYTVTPYFWALSLIGTSTIRGRSADVDVTFPEMVEHAQIPKQLFGAMLYLEARNDRWSLFSDLAYMRVRASRSDVRTISVAPEIGGEIAATADATVKMFIGEAAAAYEFASFGPPGAQTAFDAYAGLRVWWQEADASLAVRAGVRIGDLELEGSRAVAKSGDVSWVDPIVGLRMRHLFSPDKQLVIRGDIGGFDAGSQFSWQVVGTVDWEFARTQYACWKAVVGYRALGVDYSKGSGATLYEYDMIQHGPIFGVTATF